MSQALLPIMLTILVSSFATGQAKGKNGSDAQSKIVAEILRLEEALKEAGSRGDVKAIERLIADDAIATFPDGRIDEQTKKTTLTLFKSGEDFGSQVEHKNDEVKVFLHGDTAGVNGRQTSTGQYQGQEINGQVRYTHVWVKRQGRWQLVASQWALIAPKT